MKLNDPVKENELRDTLQEAASLALRQLLDVQDVKIMPPDENESRVHGHWMSMILLSGPSFTLVFKSHFFAESMLRLVSQKKNITTLPGILDFMKEYCNLLGGLIKAAFEKANVEIKVSLPVVTRGFDEIFSKNEISADESKLVWKLLHSNEYFICSAVFDILEMGFFEKLPTIKLDLLEINSTSGEFEVL